MLENGTYVCAYYIATAWGSAQPRRLWTDGGRLSVDWAPNYRYKLLQKKGRVKRETRKWICWWFQFPYCYTHRWDLKHIYYNLAVTFLNRSIEDNYKDLDFCWIFYVINTVPRDLKYVLRPSFIKWKRILKASFIIIVKKHATGNFVNWHCTEKGFLFLMQSKLI